ncbi:MAG: hypothetical protein HQL35_08235 [Alphaproteobacteria bacterium]|nr:hypothetical protein [Alphaproteobacteria bacterium]
MEIGGTGVDLGKTLPPEIEALQPDYSLYPGFKGNVGFSMRGCRRRCDFCVVPRKEGRPASASTIKDLIVQDSDLLILLDNDFFGNPEWGARLDEMRALDLRVNFNQGLNIRTINEEQAKALATVRFTNTKGTAKKITFAWDSPKDERLIKRGLDRCKAAGIKPWMMQFYVLIGFHSTPEQDLHRVHTILGWGADPFVMPFDKTQPYQKAFARWVNGRICKTVPWPEYRYAAWKGGGMNTSLQQPKENKVNDNV